MNLLLTIFLTLATESDGVMPPEPYVGYERTFKVTGSTKGQNFNFGLPFQVKKLKFSETRDFRLLIVPDFSMGEHFFGVGVNIGTEVVVPWSSYYSYGAFLEVHTGPYLGYILKRHNPTAQPKKLFFAGNVGVGIGPYLRFWDKVTARLRFNSRLLFGDLTGVDIQMSTSSNLALWVGTSLQLIF